MPERVTKEKPFGVQMYGSSGGWDSIHSSKDAAIRAARALRRKTKKGFAVWRRGRKLDEDGARICTHVANFNGIV